MTRHAIRQRQRDELAFPVRVKVAVPKLGLGKVLDAMHAWLGAELAAGSYACHGSPGLACDTAAFYFRTVEAAQAFVAAFPNCSLADGTVSPAFISAQGRQA